MKTLAEVASRLMGLFLECWPIFGIEETGCPSVHNIPGQQIILGEGLVCIEYTDKVLHLSSPKLSDEGELALNLFFCQDIFPQKDLGHKVVVIAREEDRLRYRLELLD